MRGCHLADCAELSLTFNLPVAIDQYMNIISAPDAWLIANDYGADEDDVVSDPELKPTNSARRVKALVEQVTGTYMVRLCASLFPHRHLTPVNRPLFPSSPICSPHSIPHLRTTSDSRIVPCADIIISGRV